MISTVMLVAMPRASLQPPPATMSRWRGLFALMMPMYSEIFTASCWPPMPKYFSLSFSQMPMMANTVSRTEMPMPMGVMMAYHWAL